MEKIRLDLDELDVESFATEGAMETERGTVHGAATGLCGTSVKVGCWCTEAC